jgi:stress response protein YsnF
MAYGTDTIRRNAGVRSEAPRNTGVPFWDWMLSMQSASQQAMSAFSPRSDYNDRFDGRTIDDAPQQSGQEQVIPLAEEVLTVGTHKVSAGTTRVHRYVVETPVEKQVTLVRERVVVERRRPVSDKVSGELLTELTVEVTETDEVPVVGKTLRVKEEVVVRTERSEHVETVRGTVRRDEVEVKHANKRPARLQIAS